MQSLAPTFRLEADPRILVVSDVRDFAVLKDNADIFGVTMPNPVAISEKKIREVVQAIRALPFVPDSTPEAHALQNAQDLKDNSSLPQCIKETAILLYDAFACAGLTNKTFVEIRENSSYPGGFHSHGYVGIADIYGSPTVARPGTKGHWGAPYSFPKNHITVFRDISHKNGRCMRGFKNTRLTLNLD